MTNFEGSYADPDLEIKGSYQGSAYALVGQEKLT